MANTLTMVGFNSALVTTTNASQVLTLDGDRRYAIRHTGKDATGAADTADVKLELSKRDGSDADTAVAVYTVDTDVIILEADDVYTTLRGIREIRYIRFAGGPQLNIVEVSRSIGST